MAPPLTQDERRDRFVFYPVAIVGALFCLTVFMSIAAAFGDQQGPMAKWMNQHGTGLLLWETALLVVVGFIAMTIDRLRTLKRLREDQQRQVRDPFQDPPDENGESDVG